MLLSLGDVISTVTKFAGRSDFSASEVSFFANLALTEVSNRLHHKPKETQAVSNVTGTGGERTVLLPTDFDAVIAVKWYSTSTNTAGTNVLGPEIDLPIVDTTLIDSYSSASGTPARYAVYAGNLELDPIPDSRGSLVMRYTAKQPTLILSTATPALDERWHPGWLYKTEALVHRARGNYAGADRANLDYVNYMASTPNDRQQEQSAKYGQGLWVRKS
jgi:hypothetical protein